VSTNHHVAAFFSLVFHRLQHVVVVVVVAAVNKSATVYILIFHGTTNPRRVSRRSRFVAGDAFVITATTTAAATTTTTTPAWRLETMTERGAKVGVASSDVQMTSDRTIVEMTRLDGADAAENIWSTHHWSQPIPPSTDCTHYTAAPKYIISFIMQRNTSLRSRQSLTMITLLNFVFSLEYLDLKHAA